MSKSAREFEWDIQTIVNEEPIGEDQVMRADLREIVEQAMINAPKDKIVDGTIPVQQLWRIVAKDIGMTLRQFKSWLKFQHKFRYLILKDTKPALLMRHGFAPLVVSDSIVRVGDKSFTTVDVDMLIRRKTQNNQTVGPTAIYPREASAHSDSSSRSSSSSGPPPIFSKKRK